MFEVSSPSFAGLLSFRYMCLGSLIILWMAWRLDSILNTAARSPRKVISGQYPSSFGMSLSGLLYLVAAPEMLRHHYRTGIPYAVQTLEDFNVHVYSEVHIKELSEAPEDELSLHALAKDMLQPKYTMNGLGVHDEMRANGSVHSRVLVVQLKSNLTTLQPQSQDAIAASFAQEIAYKAMNPEGFTEVQAFTMAKNVVVNANSHAFFGDVLSKDSAFLEAALRYPQDVFVASEVLRFMPSILAPVVASLITRQGQAAKFLVKRLTTVVEDRLRNRTLASSLPKGRTPDCIQWMVETIPRNDPWPAEKIVQVILGLWFASVHQLAMSVVYGLYDLCTYPEYIPLLRKELVDQAGQVDKLILMDSFLKESARICPSDSISVRRKALVPYTFSDGIHVPAGNVICMPLRAILRDSAYYKNPNDFNGFRFCNDTATESLSKLTHTESKFPLWGLGRRSW